jgi:RHS repeat-associated protein
MDNLPFGEDALTGSGQDDKHRFTSYERDNETASDYAVNRQYQMSTGRFNRPDPVRCGLANPQEFNRYAYAANDPINSIDPLGLMRRSCTRTYAWGHIRDKDGDYIGDWEYESTICGPDLDDIGEIGDPSSGGGSGQAGQNNPQNKAQRCAALIQRMLNEIRELERLWSKYDPVKDAKGGDPIVNGWYCYTWTWSNKARRPL